MLSSTDHDKLQQIMQEHPETEELFNRIFKSHQMDISTISHEIRNPLTLVYSTLQLIESQHPEVLEFAHWSELHQDIEYMKLLLEDLSSYNNGERLDLAPLSTDSFFRRIALSFASSIIDTDIEFTSYIPEDLPVLSADSVKLRQALLNLLRNAADHGLESNEERVALGKEEVGNIYLDAYQDGNNVNIEVRDDGGGINIEKVKNKAISSGTITPEQAENMTDKEVIDLLFRPSFSTAEKITDVSGRGVGLDVVKTKIEELGGNIECKSVLGEGSSFIIRLPLTLAIIQALMVELGTEKYAIPLGNIQTIEDVLISDVKYVQTKEVINLRGTVIPLIRLDQILDVEPVENDSENLTVVIVKKGDKLAGFVVDNLIGQQEIVIKSIGNYINCSKMIGGATILGDGEIALILEVNSLV